MLTVILIGVGLVTAFMIYDHRKSRRLDREREKEQAKWEQYYKNDKERYNYSDPEVVNRERNKANKYTPPPKSSTSSGTRSSSTNHYSSYGAGCSTHHTDSSPSCSSSSCSSSSSGCGGGGCEGGCGS